MLSGAIESLGAADYTVVRSAVGTTTAGRYTPGGTSNIPIRALITPVSGREVESLPEGKLASETRIILTTTELKTFDPTTGLGDRLTILGDTYEVFSVEGPWLVGGSTHYKAMASRQRAS